MIKNKPLILLMAWSLVIMSALVTSEAVAGSHIDDRDKELAKEHFAKGQNRFAAGEYMQAVEHFRVAYDLTDSPEILYNIGRCYEEAGDSSQAVIEYKMYLRISDGSDKAEVESRIEWLEGKGASAKDTAAVTENDDVEARTDSSDDDYLSASEIDEKEKKKKSKKKNRLKFFNLELRLGPGFVILLPRANVSLDRHHYFAGDFLGHFFLNDWFAVTAVIAFAGYIEGDLPITGRNAESYAGGGAGISMHKNIGKHVDYVTGILFIPTAIKRAGVTKKAVWFNFQISAGLHFLLPKNWAITTAVTGDIGPVFVVDPDLSDWDPSLYLTAGVRVGVSYTF